MNIFDSTHNEVQERDPKFIESLVPQVMQTVLDESISLSLWRTNYKLL